MKKRPFEGVIKVDTSKSNVDSMTDLKISKKGSGSASKKFTEKSPTKKSAEKQQTKIQNFVKNVNEVERVRLPHISEEVVNELIL